MFHSANSHRPKSVACQDCSTWDIWQNSAPCSARGVLVPRTQRTACRRMPVFPTPFPSGLLGPLIHSPCTPVSFPLRAGEVCGWPGQEHHGTERTRKQRERGSIPLKAHTAWGAQKPQVEWWMGHFYFKYTSILLPSMWSVPLLLEWGHETVLLCMVLLGCQVLYTLACVYMYTHDLICRTCS